MIICYALPIHSEGDWTWDFSGRNDAKAEALVLWPPHAKSWFIGEDSDAGRDWGQEKGITEDEMAGWHHWLDGRKSEWTPGVGDRQGGLACYNSWGRKESDMTEWLNWDDTNSIPCYLGVFFYWLTVLLLEGCIFLLFGMCGSFRLDARCCKFHLVVCWPF